MCVLDLGLARVLAATNALGRTVAGSLTQSGAYLGTIDFMAPEQADDPKNVDQRADIYSLGCTLYFLITGRPPFEETTALKRLMAHESQPAPSLHAARGDVPPALEAAYQAMMAKRPGDRPRTMTEVVGLLEACRSSAEESGDARAGLKEASAGTVLKRASPRGRRGPDASIFARPAPGGGPYFDPDLKLEDLVTDFRPEERLGPLPEDKLPPLPPLRLRGPRGPTQRAAVNGVAALAVMVLLAIIGYAVVHHMRSIRVRLGRVLYSNEFTDPASGWSRATSSMRGQPAFPPGL